jgi:protein tyrosine/serine phosphatase
VKTFLGVLLDPAKKPVFFHCAQGQDRTGTMCAVYRMEIEGWKNDEAFAEMQHFGFNDVWFDLEAFVKNYKSAGVAAVGTR